MDKHFSSFSPISITPEILTKCGFAFHDYFKLWQKNKKTGVTGPDMELDPDFWVLDFSHRRISVEVKNLHKLQNVYFSLKGKELEIMI